MSRLELDTAALPPALVARPLGDIDMAVTPALQAELLEAVGEEVVELPLEAIYLGERPQIALAAA